MFVIPCHNDSPPMGVWSRTMGGPPAKLDLGRRVELILIEKAPQQRRLEGSVFKGELNPPIQVPATLCRNITELLLLAETERSDSVSLNAIRNQQVLH